MSSITPETSKGRKPSDNPQDICNILLTWKDQLIIAGRLRTPTDKIWQRIKTVHGISKSTKALYSFVKCNRFNILDLLLSSASSERKIETCSDDLEQNIRTEHTSDKSLRQKSSSLITTNRKRKKSILETPTSESEEIDKRKGRRVRDNTKKVFDILLANEERIIIGGKPRTPTDSVWEQIKQENDIDTNAKSLYTFVKCNRHNILDHMQSYSPPVESILEYSDDEYQDEDIENICNGEQVIKESSVIYQDIPMVHTTDQEMSFATIEEAEQFPEHFINIGLSPSNDDSAIITEQNTSYMFRNDFENQEITEKGKKRGRKPGDDPKKVFNILLAYKDRLFREGRPVNKDDSVWEQIKQDEGLASSADALRMFVEMNRYNIRDKMQACVIPESNVHDSGQEHDNTRTSGHEMTSSVNETGEVVLEYSFGGPTIDLKEETNEFAGTPSNETSTNSDDEIPPPVVARSNSGTGAVALLPTSRPNLAKKTKSKELTNDVLFSVGDNFKKPVVQDDRYDLLGKSIAMRIRALEKREALIVEKRINDLLFEAEMRMLNTLDTGSEHFNSNSNNSSRITPVTSSATSYVQYPQQTTPCGRAIEGHSPPHSMATYFSSYNDH